MATRVIMPQLGESVVEGTLTKWLVREGDRISEFDPLMEVNTDKVDTEVPSPASGTVLKLYVEEGTTVRAGALLAVIGQPGEPLPANGGEAAPGQPAPAAPQPAAAHPSPPRDLGFVSPVAAKIAAEHNVDLQQVTGTGMGGRITKKDLLAFVEARAATPPAETPPWEIPGEGDLFRPPELQFARPPAEPAPPPAVPSPASPAVGVPVPPPPPPSPTALPGAARRVPLSAMRKSIAEHMVRSRRTSPHVSSVMEVDMSAVIAHRGANKAAFEQQGVNLTFTAYFVAASAAALRAYPIVNSSWGEEQIILHQPINIGVAVSLGEEGLIVPVIRNAQDKSLLGVARELNDLSERARAHRLKPDDVTGGTFTITNHGVTGSLFAMPIINQPQAAILGVGAIQKRVVVINDAIAIRPMCYISMTIDHRILDGAVADYFSAKVKEVLEGWQ